MAQRVPALPAHDSVPSNLAALPPQSVPSDEVAKLLPFWRPGLPYRGSDFQRLLSQVVELARILTQASGSAIALRGEHETICRASSGQIAPPVGAPVDTTFGISKQCLDSGTSVCCDDIATDHRIDPRVLQSVGIRSVAVVPIHSNGEIAGILEVFSATPGVFTDQHLKGLHQLANFVGTAANALQEDLTRGSNAEIQPNSHPDITLLVELEPAYRGFFRNLADLVWLRAPSSFAGSASQSIGWNDVFVHSHVPWKRFSQSVFLHIVVIAMLSGLSRIWPRELLVPQRPPREAHITYYPSSQSFSPFSRNRPAVHPRSKPPLAHTSHEPRVASRNGSAHDRQEADGLTAAPPAVPMFAMNRFRKLGLGAASAVPPPPDIGGAAPRQLHLPNSSVVPPPPDLRSSLGSRKLDAPGQAVVPPSPDVKGSMTRAGLISAGQLSGFPGTVDMGIVPPPPSINRRAALTYGVRDVGPNTGGQVIAPPPSVEARAELDGRGRVASAGRGVSQVVPPPPSLEGAGDSVAGGRTGSLADTGAQVVPPPPSIQTGGHYGGGGRIGSLAPATSQIASPPPSIKAGNGSVEGGRLGLLAGSGTKGGSDAASAKGDANPEPNGTRDGKDLSSPSASQVGDNRVHPVFQDVELRVIGLALALPHSSYFSNYEVYVAEKWVNKEESQLIKLVYVFLPYQRRLAEFGVDKLKVRKLRVTRDPTCDESLMQMVWPDGENGLAPTSNSGDVLASNPAERNSVLPCYRTTADDYRRAVSRNR